MKLLQRFLIAFSIDKRSFSHPSLPGMGFPDSSIGKESACNGGNLGSIPGLGRSAGEGIGYPRQYSGLENSMDSTIHGLQNVGDD